MLRSRDDRPAPSRCLLMSPDFSLAVPDRSEASVDGNPSDGDCGTESDLLILGP